MAKFMCPALGGISKCLSNDTPMQECDKGRSVWKGSRPCHIKYMEFEVREVAAWVFPIEANLIQFLEMVYCHFENFPKIGVC